MYPGHSRACILTSRSVDPPMPFQRCSGSQICFGNAAGCQVNRTTRKGGGVIAAEFLTALRRGGQIRRAQAAASPVDLVPRDGHAAHKRGGSALHQVRPPKPTCAATWTRIRCYDGHGAHDGAGASRIDHASGHGEPRG